MSAGRSVLLLLSLTTAVFHPNGVQRILHRWGKPGQIGDGLASWPTDFSRGIKPIPCHSHNDYWRLVPLYSAIAAGCISVEADVWLYEDGLYVGHTLASLTRNRTLQSLYIDPLVDILTKQNPTTPIHPDGRTSRNGVFDTVPEQSLVLLIDFKTAGPALWPHVLQALHPLRNRHYLTYRNDSQIVPGPVTVVATGSTPFDLVDSPATNPHRDVFFDAPLNMIDPDHWPREVPGGSAAGDRRDQPDGSVHALVPSEAYTTANSYYASVSFRRVFGSLSHGRFSDTQLATLRRQIREAHDRGLKARYWELPYWPIGLRNHIWQVLVDEGVDLLNVDDLKGATERDWKSRRGWW